MSIKCFSCGRFIGDTVALSDTEALKVGCGVGEQGALLLTSTKS